MASKRRIRRNACDGKQKYKSAKDALTIALIVKRKTKTTTFVNAYKCKFCNSYHWGNSK